MFILICLLLVFSAWLSVLYVLVMKKQRNIFNTFKNADNILQKTYILVAKILENNEISDDFAKNINYLKEEINKCATEPKNINRKIAFNIELEKKMNDFISFAEQNNISEESLLFINEYKELNGELQIAKEKYNIAAHTLRLVEDNFWQSLIARLNNVQSVDYMK